LYDGEHMITSVGETSDLLLGGRKPVMNGEKGPKIDKPPINVGRAGS